MNFEVTPESSHSKVRKQIPRQRIDGTNQHHRSTWYNTSVNLNWEWVKHHPKQLSSCKQITLVGGYWKIKIMTMHMVSSKWKALA